MWRCYTTLQLPSLAHRLRWALGLSGQLSVWQSNDTASLIYSTFQSLITLFVGKVCIGLVFGASTLGHCEGHFSLFLDICSKESPDELMREIISTNGPYHVLICMSYLHLYQYCKRKSNKMCFFPSVIQQ